MPLYEYHCSSCGQSFDKIVRFSEADQLPVCPNCGATDTRKKISAAAVIGGPSRGNTPSIQSASKSPFT